MPRLREGAHAHNPLFLNPDDAWPRGLAEGDPITVRSASGAVDTVVGLDDALRPGVVALSHGYGNAVGRRSAGRGGGREREPPAAVRAPAATSTTAAWPSWSASLSRSTPPSSPPTRSGRAPACAPGPSCRPPSAAPGRRCPGPAGGVSPGWTRCRTACRAGPACPGRRRRPAGHPGCTPPGKAARLAVATEVQTGTGDQRLLGSGLDRRLIESVVMVDPSIPARACTAGVGGDERGQTLGRVAEVRGVLVEDRVPELDAEFDSSPRGGRRHDDAVHVLPDGGGDVSLAQPFRTVIGPV